MPFGSLKAQPEIAILQATLTPFRWMSLVCKSITSLCIIFQCTLLNPPGKEVYRDDFSSSVKRVRVKSQWVPTEPWLSFDSSLRCLAPLCWLLRLLPFPLTHLSALGSLWGSLSPVLKPGVVPCDPGWLLLSWFPSSSCHDSGPLGCGSPGLVVGKQAKQLSPPGTSD